MNNQNEAIELITLLVLIDQISKIIVIDFL